MTHESAHRVSRRRSVFINSRIQGGTALCFAAAVLAVSVLFAREFRLSAGRSLLAAAWQGHYEFLTPYEVLGGDVVRETTRFFLGSAVACTLLFLFVVLRIRAGVNRLIGTFRISAEGDLSSPTPGGGGRDLAVLGTRIDSFRARTLTRIEAIRAEAEFLRNEPLPEKEFARRWDALKRAVRTVAP